MESSTRTERRVVVGDPDVEMQDRYRGKAGHFQQLEDGQERPSVITVDGTPDAGIPTRSVEGWILIVTNIHIESQEDDLHAAFGEYGRVKNLHLNLDRRSGFVKGYAFIEYEEYKQAQKAIVGMNGAEIFEQPVQVGWAVIRHPNEKS
eukprot:Lankesteria_metandrocarpae@DN8083_c0_g1_i1.p1